MKAILTSFFRRTDLTLTAAWTFNQLAYAIVYPFIPVYLSNERQIPYSLVGLIFPLIGLMVVCTPAAAGPMTDRLGRSFMMLFGQFARGVCFLILAVMTYCNAPFWLFAAMLMCNTAVGVAFQVGADAYLTDITLEEERTLYYSKIRIGFNLGWALGPMLGAFFGRTAFWLFFVVTSLLCFAGGIFTWVMLRYNQKHPVLDPEKKKAELERKQAAQAVSAVSKEMVLKQILHNRQLILLLCGIFLLFCLTSQLYSTLSVYATKRVGLDKTALGLIYSMNAFIVILLQIPCTNLLKSCKVPLKYQLVLGTVLYIAGYFLLGYCVCSWMIACCVGILTLGEIVIIPAVYAATANECVPENAGRILAVFSTMRGAGYAIGPWFGAQFFERIVSSVMLWGALSAFAAAALVFFLFLAQDKKSPCASGEEQGE